MLRWKQTSTHSELIENWKQSVQSVKEIEEDLIRGGRLSALSTILAAPGEKVPFSTNFFTNILTRIESKQIGKTVTTYHTVGT